MMVRSMTSSNFYDIPPYFPYKGVTPDGVLKILPQVAQRYKAFDMHYFKTLLGYEPELDFYRKVWMQLREKENVIPHPDGTMGIAWEFDGKVEALQVLCARKVSLHNKAFGGTKDGPACVYTLTNAVSKMPRVLKKLAKPTGTVFGRGRKLGALTGKAMQLLVQTLGVKPYARTYNWSFEDELKASRDVPMLSSAGIRAGSDTVVEHYPFVFKRTVNGKKADQLERSDTILCEIRDAILAGDRPFNPDRAWALIAKNEVLCSMNDAELKKFQDKCRLYNIPTLIMYRIARMVHGYRQTIERGRFIMIGFNFWSGGATLLANRFSYDKGGRRYATADFTGLDVTIKAPLLRIYSAFSDFYIRKGDDYEVYKGMLKMATENLTFKCVHFHSGVWRMVFGGMPSGAYETSHGDSWIVSLIIFQYFVDVGLRYPHMQQLIYNSVASGDLYFVVYGDDLITSVPDSLSSILGMHGISRFVQENYQMEMRDVVTMRNFLSVPSNRTGELVEEGVCFLSRYFVARECVSSRTDLPPVLPYRKLTKIVKKFAFGNGETRTDRDRVLASLGMVYDSMGTNPVAYRFCRDMFETNIETVGTVSEAVDSFDADYNGDKFLSKLLRKCNVSLDKLREGFPSREALLSMHRMNHGHHFSRTRPEFEHIW
jgi:hypothetical protein